MKRLTRVAAGSGLKDRDWRSLLLQPSEPLEPLEPFCCMRAAGQLSARQVRHKAELATGTENNNKKKERAGAEGVARAAARAQSAFHRSESGRSGTPPPAKAT